MKKTIATIIISLALLATSVTSFWIMIDTNLQLSGVRDRLEEVKLLINDEPENLKNKEERLANESKKYFIITSVSTTLFSVVVATSLFNYEKKLEKE
jgi:hypothetical protein|uniref:Uncharacterized protein n=1 Tax=Siphoviridae sp. ctHip2 TaxID=2827830 RepID=A0A8S5RWK8_9CAUD|nr:MAG TPA: hypothetical protein [Siphoviridae sp. ctHip2]